MANLIKGDNFKECPVCKKEISRAYDKAGYTVNCSDGKCSWSGERFLYEALNKGDKKNKKYLI